MNAVKKTLEIRDGAGWTIAWKEIFRARLRDGDRADRLLSNQLVSTE